MYIYVCIGLTLEKFLRNSSPNYLTMSTWRPQSPAPVIVSDSVRPFLVRFNQPPTVGLRRVVITVAHRLASSFACSGFPFSPFPHTAEHISPPLHIAREQVPPLVTFSCFMEEFVQVLADELDPVSFSSR